MLKRAGVGDFEGRCLVMGILNVTPDSFSDGGRWFQTSTAVKRGLHLVEQGADIIDVGGESTRPGAARTSADVEAARVIPVVAALVREGVTVSVDTMRATVAELAVGAGAAMVNDVSGGLSDVRMLEVVADSEVPFVLMHWRGYSDVMAKAAVYGDVVSEVIAELRRRCEVAVAAGVDQSRLVIDPGLGFAKDHHHNWKLLSELSRLHELELPILVGPSRKRFLAEVVPQYRDPEDPLARDDATTAVATLAAAAGVWAVRVHEPAGVAQAVRVAARMRAT